MNLRNFFIIFCTYIFAVIAGCDNYANLEKIPSEKLTVAASANLTAVIDELTARFHSVSEIQTVVSMGSTASLAHQIENGAPIDIFLAADTEHVDLLVKQGLISSSTRHIYARGMLVAWANSVKVKDLNDLTSPSIEVIAMPKPEVAPYGLAAVDAMKALNIWQLLKPKIVYAQNVAMSKQFVQSGNADVAFTAKSLIHFNGVTSSVSLPVSESLHQPLNQALGVVATSPLQDAARKFTAFLLSKEIQSLLIARGYRPAPQKNILQSEKINRPKSQ